MTEETKTEAPKVPTHPGSKWATGRRTRQKALVERDGFYQGARVTRRAPAATTAPKTKHRSKRK